MDAKYAQPLKDYMRSARTHLARLLREIATSLEQRNALNEDPIVLSIAGPRECLLLGNIIGFLGSADMLVPSKDVAAIQCVQGLHDLLNQLKSPPQIPGGEFRPLKPGDTLSATREFTYTKP